MAVLDRTPGAAAQPGNDDSAPTVGQGGHDSAAAAGHLTHVENVGCPHVDDTDLQDVRIVGNLRFPDWQIDVLVLARHSITIIDFKDWSGAITVRRTQPWTNLEGTPVLGGSFVNPFAQVAAYRQRLQRGLSAPVLRGNDFSHINGLVLFTQAVELFEDPGDPLGPLVDKWFHVGDWDGAIRVLRDAASPRDRSFIQHPRRDFYPN